MEKKLNRATLKAMVEIHQKNAGMSIAAIADEARISPSTLRSLINMKRVRTREPKREIIERLAKILMCDFDSLYM